MPKIDPGSMLRDDRGRLTRAPWLALAVIGLAGGLLAPGGALRPILTIVALGAAGWGLLREVATSRELSDASFRAEASATEARGVAAVSSASQAVHGLHEMDDLLRIALAEAGKLLGASSCSIMLIDSAGYLQTAATQGGNERARNARLKLGDGVAGQVALTRKPALLDGVPDPTRFPRAIQREAPLRSAMSVPLLAGDSVLGVMNVNAGDGRFFSPRDLEVLCAFAGHASIAIVNAGALRGERRRTAELGELNRDKAETMAGVAQDLRSGGKALGDLVARLSLGRPVDNETLDEITTGIQRIVRTSRQLRGEGDAAAPAATRSTDLSALARTVAEDFLAQGREVTVRPSGPCHVQCDEDLLRQALWNLLEGAFTLGKPPVTISVECQAGEGVVSVADRGLPSNMRAKGGDGLGMAVSLVHGLVSGMGGRVWAENGEDGTAFRIGLPKAGAEMVSASGEGR